MVIACALFFISWVQLSALFDVLYSLQHWRWEWRVLLWGLQFRNLSFHGMANSCPCWFNSWLVNRVEVYFHRCWSLTSLYSGNYLFLYKIKCALKDLATLLGYVLAHFQILYYLQALNHATSKTLTEIDTTLSKYSFLHCLHLALLVSIMENVVKLFLG